MRQVAARKAWETMRARKAAGGDPIAAVAVAKKSGETRKMPLGGNAALEFIRNEE
jgi:hypothetical protein